MRPARPARPARPSRRPLAGLVAAVLAATGAVVIVPLPASAAARPFTPVFTQNTTGDILIRGNTLMTCPAGSVANSGTPPRSCTEVQAGVNGNNDQFAMTHVDVDSDLTTFNSSSAAVSVPDGARVLFAGLSWGGTTATGIGGSPAPDAAKKNTVKLSAPGSGYVNVFAPAVDTMGTHYQGFADVTTAVGDAGPGDYTVANVQAGTGRQAYAGWALTVVYEDPAEPLRNLVVFNGYDNLASNNVAGLTLSVDGFTTPTSGPVATRLGVVAYEGDKGLVGDQLALDGDPVSDSANPVTDVFNSSITDLGAPVTERAPAYANQLGYDIDRFDVPGLLDNGDTQTSINLKTSGDGFYPGVLTFATDLYTPLLTATKSVVDVNGGDVRPGDQLDYSIEVENTKTDAALQTVLTDVIPEHTGYVPNSLSIDGVWRTDTWTDDPGRVADGRVTAFLGADATWQNGGRLASGESTTVTFSVQVAANAVDATEIINTADLSYQDEASSQLVSGASNEVTSTVVLAPVITTTDLPAGRVSVAYSQQLTAEGGTGFSSWSVSEGALPAGITLDPGKGLLSGTPTATGTFEFTIKVTDQLNRSDTEDVKLEVSPGVSLSANFPSVNFNEKVTLTASVAPSDATGTVTFSVAPAAPSSSDDNHDLGTFPLVAGTAAATVAMPRLGLNQVTATYNGDTRYPVGTSPPVAVEAKAYQGQVLVTEFRTSGQFGADDSYIEITNMGPDVPLEGFTVETDSGVKAVLDSRAGTLGSGRSFLLGGQDLSSYAAHLDWLLTSFGEEGIQVVAPDAAGTVTDAVGPSGAGFHRGTPLPSFGREPGQEYAWWRTQVNGLPVDTGDNDADFALVTVDGGDIAGVRATIGSPSPTSTTSPHRHNSALTSTLLDPRVAESMGVNRHYVAGPPGSPGTLTVRRTITNTSDALVTRANVRITALSAHDGEPRPGTLPQPTSHAALRVVSPNTYYYDLLPVPGKGTYVVYNLEPHALQGQEGGGLNTSMDVQLPSSGLAPGESVHVAFTFAVDAPGRYWFGYDVDAHSDPISSCSSSGFAITRC